MVVSSAYGSPVTVVFPVLTFKHLCDIPTGSSPAACRGTKYRWGIKNYNFRPITHYTSQTIQGSANRNARDPSNGAIFNHFE